MAGTSIIVAGIEIPSSDPVFLAVVGVHVLLGLACTITGIIAMLSPKRIGRHPLIRYELLLVSDRSIRDCERSDSSPMGRRLSPVYSRSACFCVCISGAQGAAQALEQLGQAAYHRHGDVIYSAADGFLCGQWKELAALERTSSACILAGPRCGWNIARAPSAVGARMAGACPDGSAGTHNLAAVVEWHIHEIRDSLQSVHVFHESSS